MIGGIEIRGRPQRRAYQPKGMLDNFIQRKSATVNLAD